MKMFLDTELLDLATEAAKSLVATEDAEVEFHSPPPAETPFLICRDLFRGRMPLGKVELDGATFYICVDTGTARKGT